MVHPAFLRDEQVFKDYLEAGKAGEIDIRGIQRANVSSSSGKDATEDATEGAKPIKDPTEDPTKD
ncbi:uncharacterized protein N7477_008536 [Penicillium maclennaniae]|uniref:uncharacterized protein n=1 Tax=Penicillium maclennaniae TaxID=1343394 RepID=UPI0025404382|nr:uncharacterized protein N7477_008536 [Penicillium maclennaniae]KAJ5666088.1 hypothetical protein N7477_008536 [Penicillium maclennaniae]